MTNIQEYSEDQPRDDHGMWVSGGMDSQGVNHTKYSGTGKPNYKVTTTTDQGHTTVSYHKTEAHANRSHGSHLANGWASKVEQMTHAKESYTMTEPTKSRALIGTIIPLEEAAYDSGKGLLTVTVIKPGFSRNTLKLANGQEAHRYYPADMLKKSVKLFEGAKMFADHATAAEDRAQPAGSVKNWVGSIKKVWAESDGTVRAQSAVIDPQFKAKLEELNKQGMLGQMGISVRIAAEVSDGNMEGKPAKIIENMVRARSVDFVTVGAAGGKVELMESFIQEDGNDLDLVSEAELRQRRPDLVQLIESKSDKSGEKSMSEKTLEQQLIEAQTALAAEKTRADAAEVKAKKLQETSDEQVASIATLTTKIEESEVAAQKATAQTELGKMLAESLLAKLPEAVRVKACKRITSQFAEALTTEGMKESISEEEAYVKLMNGPAKVTKMGEQDNATTARKTNLKESFMKRGMSEQEATIAAAGRR